MGKKLRVEVCGLISPQTDPVEGDQVRDRHSVKEFLIKIFPFRSSVCKGEGTLGSSISEEAFKICKHSPWVLGTPEDVEEQVSGGASLR